MYYVLLEKQPADRWTIQFSDEDLETVRDELQAYEEGNHEPVGQRPIYKIIATRGSSTISIMKKVNALNERDAKLPADWTL